MSACGVCESLPELGQPSVARWVGPDGNEYCSMHFVGKFGHAEPLVKVEGFEAPTQVKAPAPKTTKKGAANGRRKASSKSSGS
jgi:hypothetical protein